jgi:uncharacterized membrane protein YfcA
MVMSALAWLAAALIGLTLGLLGAGGSIVTVPVLVYVVGPPYKTAIAASLAIVGGIATAGALQSARRHRVDWRSVVLFGGPGVPSASIGAWLARFASGNAQLATFAIVMLAAAWFTARARPAEDRAVDCHRCGLLLMMNGAAVGVLTGFVGVGGGFLIVPALLLLGGLSIDRAIGSSLAIIAINSWTGLSVSLADASSPSLDWAMVAIFVAVGTGGSIAGQSVSALMPPRRLRTIFAAALLAVGGFVLTQSVLRMR